MPRKKSPNPASQLVAVRWTEAAYAELARRAGAQEISISEYLRRSALKGWRDPNEATKE